MGIIKREKTYDNLSQMNNKVREVLGEAQKRQWRDQNQVRLTLKE